MDNQSKLGFKDYVNLAWSFAKVDRGNKQFWGLIEEQFLNEIEQH